MPRFSAASVLAALTLAAVAPLEATVLFDTGPGASSTTGGYALTGEGAGSYQALATQFINFDDITITSVDLWLAVTADAPLTVSLFSDDGGLPGTSVLSASFSPGVSPTPGWQTIDNLDWSVSFGAFWLVVEPGADFDGVMPTGAPSPFGGYALDTTADTGSGWEPITFLGGDGLGFRIKDESAMIPEPGTSVAWAAGACLALVLLVRRRRH